MLCPLGITERKIGVLCKNIPAQDAGYAHRAYANSSRLPQAKRGSSFDHKAQKQKPPFWVVLSNLGESASVRFISAINSYKLYARGVRVRAEHKKRNRNSQGVPISFFGEPMPS